MKKGEVERDEKRAIPTGTERPKRIITLVTYLLNRLTRKR